MEKTNGSYSARHQVTDPTIYTYTRANGSLYKQVHLLEITTAPLNSHTHCQDVQPMLACKKMDVKRVHIFHDIVGLPFSEENMF